MNQSLDKQTENLTLTTAFSFVVFSSTCNAKCTAILIRQYVCVDSLTQTDGETHQMGAGSFW